MAVVRHYCSFYCKRGMGIWGGPGYSQTTCSPWDDLICEETTCFPWPGLGTFPEFPASDWIMFSSKFACWIPNPQRGDAWKWSLREVIRSWGWVLPDGISAVIRRDSRELACCLCEDMERRQLWGVGPLPRTDYIGTLILVFFILWNCEKILFCYLSHLVYGVLLPQSEQTNTK
jgi:hypothetical protein